MSNEEELLKKRFHELIRKSESCAYYIFTDFLGPSELSLFNEAILSSPHAPYKIYGGTDGAERVMVRLGNEVELGYDQPFPISILKVEPTAQKFADRLTHRDFLGALLNLGIERTVLGDILIKDNVGYVFVKDDIAEYIVKELTRVKRTAVKVTLKDELPDTVLYQLEEKTIQLSGERLDAAVAKVFNLSRDDALTLFRKKLVFVGGRCCENNSQRPKENDVISVRGYGRFVYCGQYSTSKKGKLNVLVKLYV